jgi:hypothetical protein
MRPRSTPPECSNHGQQDQQRDEPNQLTTPDRAAEVEDRLPLDLSVPYHEGAHGVGGGPEPSPRVLPASGSTRPGR